MKFVVAKALGGGHSKFWSTSQTSFIVLVRYVKRRTKISILNPLRRDVSYHVTSIRLFWPCASFFINLKEVGHAGGISVGVEDTIIMTSMVCRTTPRVTIIVQLNLEHPTTASDARKMSCTLYTNADAPNDRYSVSMLPPVAYSAAFDLCGAKASVRWPCHATVSAAATIDRTPLLSETSRYSLQYALITALKRVIVW
jgi:hypothetical protein